LVGILGGAAGTLRTDESAVGTICVCSTSESRPGCGAGWRRIAYAAEAARRSAGTLAGLLFDDLHLRTRWTDRVILVDDDEIRLTEWMTANLRVSWCKHLAPCDAEAAIIRMLRPPLNVDHATGPSVDLVKAARRRYRESAGVRPS
jgi:hypothetical protein